MEVHTNLSFIVHVCYYSPQSRACLPLAIPFGSFSHFSSFPLFLPPNRLSYELSSEHAPILVHPQPIQHYEDRTRPDESDMPAVHSERKDLECNKELGTAEWRRNCLLLRFLLPVAKQSSQLILILPSEEVKRFLYLGKFC